MADAEPLSTDAHAIILACSSIGFAREDEARPFGPRGWASVVDRLAAQGAGPGAMLGLPPEGIVALLGEEHGPEARRLARLLGRSGQLAFELDRLRARGIWVETLVDAGYPTQLRERLDVDAPPVLFGAGQRSILTPGGVAIVGSRDDEDRAGAFTRALATAVARGRAPVVSGGGRGVDHNAMRWAFVAGGTVVDALPEGIERRLREAPTRSAVANGRIVLLSPYHPAAGFSVGAAMARNKMIYALSDVAVVVSCGAIAGGTWAGALEALDAGSVPVIVRSEANVPEGNRLLMARGGRPLSIDHIPTIATAAALVSATGPASPRAAEASALPDQQELTLTE